jgi:Family of unknown function (DUF6521)
MTPWSQWSEEERLLLNPALLSAALTFCAKSYFEQTGHGLPLPLAVVSVVLVLTPSFRSEKPKTTRTVLSAWLSEHPEHRVRLSQRAPFFVDPVRHAVIFGCRYEALRIDEDGGLLPGTLKKHPVSEDVTAIFKTADFVGRWFAMTGAPSTVMTLWGVKP